jgi:hypothetical protein
MIVAGGIGTTADERASSRGTAMTLLARSLPLAAALALLPGVARADPTAPIASTTLTALQTVAVANDAGVAEALAQPSTPGTTKVTVEVRTETGSPAPTAAATAPTPEPTAVPEPPLPHLAGYQPPPYSERIYQDRKSGPKLVAAGFTLGITAYVFTTLAGALTIDKAREMTDDPLTPENEARHRADRRAYGRALLVPGIGPGIAIARADTAMRAWGAGFAGLAQGLAVGLTIVGIHRLARARRLERLSVAAMAGSREAHVSLGVRF